MVSWKAQGKGLKNTEDRTSKKKRRKGKIVKRGALGRRRPKKNLKKKVFGDLLKGKAEGKKRRKKKKVSNSIFKEGGSRGKDRDKKGERALKHWG